MLFGFVGAIIAGFLLTAIPNWTGRLPIAGRPLAGLFASGRRRGWRSCSPPDRAWRSPRPRCRLLYRLLALLAAREVLAAKNRNLPVVAIVLLLGVANAADHAGAAGISRDADIGVRGAIALIVMAISLIGGRIIPSFTRNWMTKQGMTRPPARAADAARSGGVGADGRRHAAWTAWPDPAPAGWLLIAAGLAGAAIVALGRAERTRRDPLVLILHVGYFWVPVGLALLGLGSSTRVPRSRRDPCADRRRDGDDDPRGDDPGEPRPYRARAESEPADDPGLWAGHARRAAAGRGLAEADRLWMGIDVAGMAWGGAFLLFLIAYAPGAVAPAGSASAVTCRCIGTAPQAASRAFLPASSIARSITRRERCLPSASTLRR